MNSGSGGEVLQISGIRVGDAIETEPLSPGVLTKFAFEPALFSATPTSGDAGREPPRSDRDCFHGRWRRFFDLDLRGLRHCIAFVARHHDRDDFPGERRR
jgi:hypothetical protein